MIYNRDYIYQLLEQVKDPEIPAMSVIDMAILRDVKVMDDFVEVVITPTYSGCPAMKTIEDDIKACLLENGYINSKVSFQMSPAWTTDWMTEEAKLKLKSSGIAPPQGNAFIFKPGMELPVLSAIVCPYCSSDNTRLESQFGSTACKSLYFCRNCMMPFDYFKPH